MRTASVLVGSVLVACTSSPVDTGDEGSSSGASGTSTTTMSATTTSATTADSSTTLEPSTGPAQSTGPTESTGSVDSSSSAADPGACDFATAVAESIADASDPADCGQLTAADPLMAWEEARMCARQAQLNQLPFSLSWQWDDGGTVRDRAYASNGFSMPLMYFEDDAATGTTSISVVACTGTGTPPMCTVAVGEPCLECLDPTIATELCG